MLSDGMAVDYDWLVLSLGSESTTLGVPGVKEHAVLFNTIGDAMQVTPLQHCSFLGVGSLIDRCIGFLESCSSFAHVK